VPGVLREEQLPREAIEVLGPDGSARIDRLVHDLVENSAAAADIVQGPEAGAAMGDLRDFMFSEVYLGAAARREAAKVERVIRTLFEEYVSAPDRLPDGGGAAGADLAQRVTDYIAGMTDRFATRLFVALTVPAEFTSDGAVHAGVRRTSARRGRLRRSRGVADRAAPFRHQPARGPVPVPRRADPVVRDRSGQEALPLLRVRRGRQRSRLRHEARRPGLQVGDRALADRYGVELEVEDEDPAAQQRRIRRERLQALLERTASFYERVLWESKEADAARTYLLERGLTEEALRTYRVGYAPSAWDTVLMASQKAGYSTQELFDVGLAKRNQKGGLYDQFRSRITFPLSDARGRVIGFGARQMSEDRGPKYLNTPENDLFHKGRIVYGGHLARSAAAKAGAVIVAEGYTDVIALHQAGFSNAVCIMGTSLTEEQVKVLRRLAPVAHLALDADNAGQEAMLRAARVAAGEDLKLRVLALPEGLDPADLVSRQGPEAFSAILEESTPFARFRILRILATGDRTSAEGKEAILEEMQPTFAALPEIAAGRIMRDELVQLISSRLDLTIEQVTRALARPTKRSTSSGPPRGRGTGSGDGRSQGAGSFRGSGGSGARGEVGGRGRPMGDTGPRPPAPQPARAAGPDAFGDPGESGRRSRTTASTIPVRSSRQAAAEAGSRRPADAGPARTCRRSSRARRRSSGGFSRSASRCPTPAPRHCAASTPTSTSRPRSIAARQRTCATILPTPRPGSPTTTTSCARC
jgi:DNA primase catalytic core